MQAGIHPQYYPQAKAKCACGHTWTTGSTQPELKVEICSQCHPFYSGKEKILDTRGRVDKFKKRLEKQVKLSTKKVPRRGEPENEIPTAVGAITKAKSKKISATK